MERKIGEIFTCGDKTYQVVKGITCRGCIFMKDGNCYTVRESLGPCDYTNRTDKIGIIFKEVNNMEIKNNQLTIDIPEGMEVDTENSDLAKGIIKFKNKVLSYKTVHCEICNKSLFIDIHKEDENKLRAISKLMNIAKYYNKDWKPDWSNNREDKWYIYYDHFTHNYIVSSHVSFSEDNIYFKHKNDAIAVTNNLNFRSILDAIYKN